MKKGKVKTEPAAVSSEYRIGTDYKSGIGRRGIHDQATVNERFYIGDQWHGAQCGNDRPLVRRNLIKRIGEYKMAAITAAPVAVNYTADGVTDESTDEEKQELRSNLMQGAQLSNEAEDLEVSVIMAALSDYFRTTAERVKFDIKLEQLLHNAYISGTGLCYTYWDDRIETGLYADERKQTSIRGDIAFEVVDVENVVFGDPNNDDVQSQPWITIAVRRDVDEVRREAIRNRIPEDQIEAIKPDHAVLYGDNAGERGEQEPINSRRVTVYTKFYKDWDEKAENYRVMCVRTTKTATVRKPWDLKIRNYPIAKFCWERRRSCAYGESEITYMIPNQIAINRALTAVVWGLMETGMPVTLVNGDLIDGPVTNSPGQIIRIYGTAQDMDSAFRYVQPPAFSAALQNMIEALASNTLSDMGANDAALGNLRPDNAAAIIQVREAAIAPLQVYMNRYYDLCEDIARIWADFWLNLYGNRRLRIEDKGGVHYIPFDAKRYKNLVVNARIDVGASTLWSESVVISTLDRLLQSGLITFEQYLERLPGGLIPDITGLKQDVRRQMQAQIPPQEAAVAAPTQDEILSLWAQQQPELYQKYLSLPPEEQQSLLNSILGGGGTPTPAVADAGMTPVEGAAGL